MSVEEYQLARVEALEKKIKELEQEIIKLKEKK